MLRNTPRSRPHKRPLRKLLCGVTRPDRVHQMDRARPLPIKAVLRGSSGRPKCSGKRRLGQPTARFHFLLLFGLCASRAPRFPSHFRPASSFVACLLVRVRASGEPTLPDSRSVEQGPTLWHVGQPVTKGILVFSACPPGKSPCARPIWLRLAA